MNDKNTFFPLLLILLVSVLYSNLEGGGDKNHGEMVNFSKYYFIKSIIFKEYEPINQNDISTAFAMLDKIISIPDSTIIIDRIYNSKNIKIYKAELPFRSSSILEKTFFAIRTEQFVNESYELNKDNIVNFVNNFITIDRSTIEFSALISFVSKVVIKNNAIILTNSNIHEFSYLFKEYKMDFNNEIKEENANYYSEKFYKIKNGNISSYYNILYSLVDHKFNIEKQLLFKIIE